MEILYKSFDGIIFENKKDCELYEKSLREGGRHLEIGLRQNSTTIRCPCGKSEILLGGANYNSFIKRHRDHSNGVLFTYIEALPRIPLKIRKII